MTNNFCPICGSNEYTTLLHTKDFTTTHEHFDIVACNTCGLAMTFPRPDKLSIANYYQTSTYISHRDQAKNLIDSIYLKARQYALEWKIKRIREINDQAQSIFDFGCGTGEFLRHCLSKGYHAIGYEPSISAKTIAEKKNPQALVNQIDDIQNPVDIITLWHVLEHVHELRETINQLASKLKVDGTMLIAVPNYRSHDANHFKNHWAGYDTPRHLWHFDRDSMTRLLETSNLKVIGTIPMKLDAFYISLISHQYKIGKVSPIMSMATGFWSGLWSNIKAKQTGEFSSIIYLAKHA